MKKHLVAAAISSVILVAFAYIALLLLPVVFPGLAESYYEPTFRAGSTEEILFFVHPVILSFLLSWFWYRFKGQFDGSFVFRGVELGAVYGLIAIVPAMMINYSVLNITLPLVMAWLAYGILQGIIAGVIFAKIDP